MALIKLGGLAQDVRGTLNGSVFSRNRGGAYIRTKVSPVQPVSEFSSASRAIFKAVSQRWSTVLTDVQRQGWIAFAATHPFINVFGDSHILSGLAFYQSVNKRLAQMGQDFLDDAPPTFDVEDLGITAIDGAITGIQFATLAMTIGRALETDELLYVWLTTPILGARQPQKNDFRLLNAQDDTEFADDDDLVAPFEARYPDTTILSTSRLFYRMQAVNTATGAASAPVTSAVTIA